MTFACPSTKEPQPKTRKLIDSLKNTIKALEFELSPHEPVCVPFVNSSKFTHPNTLAEPKKHEHKQPDVMV